MNTELRGDHIAVIGMAGRFPGARNIEEFWQNLVDGVESITFLTDEELLQAGDDRRTLDDPTYVKACPMLPDMEWFDAPFFGFTAREADIRDPQQRVFLETAHAALEHAGYDPRRYPGAVGVYGGIYSNRYAWLNVRKNRAVRDAVGPLAVEVSNHSDYLCTLVSYKLNLKGPSLTVATACSTSLVATHLACQALRNGECDMALSGGVEIELPHPTGYTYTEGGIMSPDGHCRAFDAKAQGTVFGNGVGVVVLKRLADALADGDHIHAVIRGSAINNDGSQKVGFTAPSVDGQVAVIGEAYGVAEVDPRTVTFVEAHGTATALGDPIEVNALSQVFAANSEDRNWCAIGSAKTNVGHLGPAAGVTGLIKAVLALERRKIPPILHYEVPNPRIDFSSSPFFVNTQLLDWPDGARPRRAGVSSFGIGGTNAHAVLEQAPAQPPSGPSRPRQLLLLSARTEAALEAAWSNLARHLEANPDLNLADAAYTLQVGREAMAQRSMVVCRDARDAVEAMSGANSGRVLKGQAPSKPPSVAFLFPGQGAQHPNMAQELYQHEATFRRELDRCAELLTPALGLNLLDVLYPPSERTEDAGRQLAQTALTQPTLFAVEYALAQLWIEWGVRAEAMIGHSIGEYVAACLAGVFSLEDALSLVAARGSLMQGLPAGTMLAVPLPEDELAALLPDDLSLATVNAPVLCVVSGPAARIDAFAKQLRERGIEGTRLKTSHAFHSSMMDPILAPFADRVRQARPRPPRIPFVSNLTGTWITDEEATDPGYWATHLRHAVRFSAGVTTLLADKGRMLLEVGPGNTLTGLTRQHPNSAGRVFTSLRHPQKQDSDQALMLGALGRLWLAGATVDWAGFSAHERRRRVVLPGYPYQRKRHWVEPTMKAQPEAEADSGLQRLPFEDWFSVPVWRQIPVPPVSANGQRPQGPWLIFTDSCGIGADLVERLQRHGDVVNVVVAGDAFADLGDGRFTLQPGDRGQYLSLFEALRAADQLPRRIVHLFTVTRPAGTPTLAEERELQQLGFYSLLFLGQAIATYRAPGELALTVISSGTHDVLGGEPVAPAKAAVAFIAVMEKEFEQLTCRSVDITLPEPGEQANLVDRLFTELSLASPEATVAYRRGRRWARAYAPVRLQDVEGSIDALREGLVCLITGGLGAVGLVFARFLAEAAHARLAVVGRSAFPARDEWTTYLESHDETDRVVHQIRQIQSIESLGGEVLVLSADVTDEQQMRTVIERTRAHFGALNGVIHAAGIAPGGMLAVKSKEAVAAVLSPKVDGVAVLDRALRDIDLDFFILCSSVVSVGCDFGLGDYCAANSVLDAYAQRTARGPRRAVSINFPAWLEVGMAVEAAAPAAFREMQRGASFEAARHPLLTRRIHDQSEDIVFSSVFTPESSWVIDEHRIDGQAVLPGVGYLELVRAAFAEATASEGIELRDVLFLAPLRVKERREVRTKIRPGGGTSTFTVVAGIEPAGKDETQWTEYARGTVRSVPLSPAPVHDLEAIRARCPREEVYPEEHRRRGIVQTGPRWDNIKRMQIGENEELALLELHERYVGDLGTFVLHPSLLDAATSFAQSKLNRAMLPFGYGSVLIRAPLPRVFYSHIKYRNTSADSNYLIRDVVLMDPDGTELVRIEGFTLVRIDPEAVLSALGVDGAPVLSDISPNGDADLATSIMEKKAREEFIFGIRPAEAVEAVRRILAYQVEPQVVITPEGMERKLARAKRMTSARIAEELGNAALAAPAQVERTVGNEYVAPSTELEQVLATMWGEAIGVSPVGVEDDFFELGGNSLVAVQLASRVRDRFKIELAVPVLFESPTIRTLARAVEAAILEKVQTMTEEQAKELLQLVGEPA